jgi:hypothetical protein
MKLGAEPKRLTILAGLLLVAAYVLYTNVFSGSSVPSTPAAVSTPSASAKVARAEGAAEVPPEISGPAPRAEAPRTAASKLLEFRPSLKSRRKAGGAGLSPLDATLRLDLLARLQEVKVSGGGRSLFDFGPAPLPKTPEPKVIPKPVQTVPPPPPPPPEPVKPQPPVITLKYFGYAGPTTQSRPTTAFFKDGDEIIRGEKGDLLKKRYRIEDIRINAVDIVDTQFDSKQTLNIEPKVN